MLLYERCGGYSSMPEHMWMSVDTSDVISYIRHCFTDTADTRLTGFYLLAIFLSPIPILFRITTFTDMGNMSDRYCGYRSSGLWGRYFDHWVFFTSLFSWALDSVFSVEIFLGTIATRECKNHYIFATKTHWKKQWST